MTKLKVFSKNSIYLALALSLSLVSSCSKLPPAEKYPSDPAKAFLKSFNETIKLDAPLYTCAKLIGKTLWIYAASEKEVLSVERAQRQGHLGKKYLEFKGDFPEPLVRYRALYEIKELPETKYEEEPISVGLTENYTDTAQEIITKVYSSISDILYTSDKAFNFFAICVADIKKGIEIGFTINKADMEKYVVGIIPAEEFHNRVIFKARGDEKIVNDKQGLHLGYKDISLTDFIIELVSLQIRQEFLGLKDEEKTGEKLQEIILKNLHKVMKVYELDKLETIELENTLTGAKLTVSRPELLERFKESGF